MVVCLATAATGHAQTRLPTAPAAEGVPRPGPSPAGPVRDPDAAARAVAPTAAIRGRVFDRESGQPLRRARVTILATQAGETTRTVLTDADGAFELAQLPPGRHTVRALKPGYVPFIYGQTDPRHTGKAIEVANGRTVDGITLALSRGAVITGRIVDEEGEILPDVDVIALQYTSAGGKRTLAQVTGSVRTNDIGIFRLFGLPPGEYYVRASYADAAFGKDVNASGAYTAIYFPGTALATEAQPITVRAAEESSADFSVVPLRGTSIAGIAVDSSGQPLTRGFVSLRVPGDASESVLRGGSIRPNGTFVISGVPPGSYIAAVAGVRSVDALSGAAVDPREQTHETGRMLVNVAGEPITDLRIATTRGVVLTGRLLFEGGRAPATGALEVACLPVEGETSASGNQSGYTQPDLTFELRDIYGPCILAARVPRWMVKTVRMSGTDVTDVPVELSGRGASDIEITLTNRLPVITGTVTDGDTPARDYDVLVFPSDTKRWKGSRRLFRRGSVDQNGQFSVVGVPPGEYAVVALRTLPEGSEMELPLLERLRDAATPVRLGDGGMQSVSLKLVELPKP